jgi:hypothetical protein
LHRLVKLRSAITLCRSEDVTRQTLGMDSYERWYVAAHLAFKYGKKLLIAGQRAITRDLKLAPFRG